MAAIRRSGSHALRRNNGYNHSNDDFFCFAERREEAKAKDEKKRPVFHSFPIRESDRAAAAAAAA